MKAAALIAVALCALGCEEDPVKKDHGTVLGEWRSSAPVVDQSSDLVVDDGGDATATLFIVLFQGSEPSAGQFEFEATWELDDGDYAFAMNCLSTPFGECEYGDDFMMVCDLDDDALACTGDNNWSEYDFSWRR